MEEDFVVAESPTAASLDFVVPDEVALLPIEARSLGAAATPASTPFDPGRNALFGARLPLDAVIVARSPLPEWEYQVGRGTEVWTSDNWEIGRVAEIEVADDGHPLALLVSSPFRRVPQRVPFDAITQGEPERLVVGMTANAFLQREAEARRAGEEPYPG